MSQKNSLRYQLVSGQSLAASFNTSPTMVKVLDNCSYQINITTSDSIGTFKVQASDDYQASGPNDNVVVNAGNWVDLTLAGGSPTVSAANDHIIINLNQLPFNAIRLDYTAGTAGTGTCDIWVVCKRLGG